MQAPAADPMEGEPFPRGSLVLLVGPPAAGKSTLAAALVAVGLVDARDVLAADRYRARLTGDAADLRADRRVWPLLRLALRERLALGHTTVVDATNVHAAKRGRHLRVAQGFGRSVSLRFAVQQIVPPAVTVRFGVDVDPASPVTWSGGQPWNRVLAAAVQPLGLRIVTGASSVLILR